MFINNLINACKKYNIKYIDINKYLFDSNYKINRMFVITHSPSNIHLYFAHVLPVFIFKSDLNFLIDHFDKAILVIYSYFKKWKRLKYNKQQNKTKKKK